MILLQSFCPLKIKITHFPDASLHIVTVLLVEADSLLIFVLLLLLLSQSFYARSTMQDCKKIPSSFGTQWCWLWRRAR